jgi:Concanavalin A-like lectin/glucanases superfamily
LLLNLGGAGYSKGATLENGATVISSVYMVGAASLSLVSSNSQYVQIPTFTSLSNGLSFAVWFKAYAVGDWGRILDFGNGAGSDNIHLFFLNSYLGLSVYNGGSADEVYYVVDDVNDDTWRHVVWTMDFFGNWIIYINGVTYWTSSSRFYPYSIAREYNYIGRSNWDVDPYYNGQIDDFRMYNIVLTATDALNIFSSANGIPMFLPSKAPSRMCLELSFTTPYF